MCNCLQTNTCIDVNTKGFYLTSIILVSMYGVIINFNINNLVFTIFMLYTFISIVRSNGGRSSK